MSNHLDIVVVNNIKFHSCNKLIEIIKAYREGLYLFCGGIGECIESIELVDRGYGIVNVYDDEYIIKLLKQRNMFVGGRWVKTGRVCIAGIDAKNPVQAIERITLNAASYCSTSIIISAYTPSPVRCSNTTLMGKTISIGLSLELLDKILELSRSIPTLFLTCSEYSQELCIDRLSNNFVIISIPRQTSLLRLKLDMQNLGVVLVEHLG